MPNLQLPDEGPLVLDLRLTVYVIIGQLLVHHFKSEIGVLCRILNGLQLSLVRLIHYLDQLLILLFRVPVHIEIILDVLLDSFLALETLLNTAHEISLLC